MPSCALEGSRIRHDDLFAEQRGARAHAKVDGAVLRQLHLDAAVLRHAPLRDVEPRHDLEARRRPSSRAATGGRAISFSTPSCRRRMRKCFSYGSKWMSDAPRLDRVEHDLVDEADDRRVVDRRRSRCRRRPPRRRPMTSRFSRSKSPSSSSDDIVVSTASMARLTRASSLSCSTTTGSMRSVVWNLISSSACRLVGSQTAMYSRLPRCRIGRMRCFSSSFSSTELDDVEVEVDGVEIEQRHAELVGGRNGDLARIARAGSRPDAGRGASSCRRSRRAPP